MGALPPTAGADRGRRAGRGFPPRGYRLHPHEDQRGGAKSARLSRASAVVDECGRRPHRRDHPSPIKAEHAFWTWAALVEVVRLSGIRHEELLELTHLSIRQFQRPNGDVVALLVIAPSKTDRERVIPMSVELFHVIAELVRHHTPGGRSGRRPTRLPHLALRHQLHQFLPGRSGSQQRRLALRDRQSGP